MSSEGLSSELQREHDQQLAQSAVVERPVTEAIEVETSAAKRREPEIVTDGGRAIEHSPEYEQQTDRRPMDCDCLPTFEDLPCWPCYRDGFRMPNPNATLDE